MKIAQNKMRIRTPSVKKIIKFKRVVEKHLKKGECLAIKSYNTPDIIDPGT